jgi:hypothetical protein
MTFLPDGIYQIAFTGEQLLSAPEIGPGAPLMLLPDGGPGVQEWEVLRADDDTYTISARGARLYVSYDGEPDMHELAILLPERRSWRLLPGAEPDTYSVNVLDAPMRLGLSLLRIFPPRVALAPEYGDPYQAWTFKNIG